MGVVLHEITNYSGIYFSIVSYNKKIIKHKIILLNKLKLLQLFILLGSLLFPTEADHLLLTSIVTQPDAAESFSIYNPTDSPIDLTNYYICDDEEYYKMQTEGDMAPSSSISGFTARFPSISIRSGDTLHVILNSDYSGFYGEEFTPDIIMYGSENNSMLETEPGSIGFSAGKLNETSELLILFYWVIRTIFKKKL